MNRRHFLTTLLPGAIMATRTSAGNPDHRPFPDPKLIAPAPSHQWPDCDPPEDSNAACQDREHEPIRRTDRPRPDPQPKPQPHPEKPEPKPEGKPHDEPKGNASANNGKGGNYGKTGHQDNGKGKGRDRK